MEKVSIEKHYSPVGDIAQALGNLDEVVPAHGGPTLRGSILAGEDVAALFKSLPENIGGLRQRTLWREGEVRCVDTMRMVTRAQKKLQVKCHMLLCLSSEYASIVAMSVAPRDEFVEVGQAYLARLHPKAARVYLSTTEQFELLERVVQKVNPTRAAITRLTYMEKFIERFTTEAGEEWRESTRKSTKRSLEGAKKLVEDEAEYLTRVRMNLRIKRKSADDSRLPVQEATVGVTREGDFLCRGLVRIKQIKPT